MGETTEIAWCNKTWNPWHGCHKISPGCKNCYMFSDKARYGQDPNVVVRSRTTFNQPLKWKDPAMVFTCSWSDWFIEEADNWRPEAYDIIAKTPHLTYQILTKRIERAAAHWCGSNPPMNAWLGVSVEDRKYGLPRIDKLRIIPAYRRFLSIEPQLEDLGKLDLTGIHWVIIGGESGHGARPFDVQWARNTIRQCRGTGTAVFFKQYGADPREGNANGSCNNFDCTHPDCGYVRLKLKDKKGGDMAEWAIEDRVREFPL